MNKTTVGQVFPILLTIGLLWYVLKDIPVNALAIQFSQTNYWWLAVVGTLIGLYYLTRAARWQLTLQALGYQPSLFRTTIALLAGSLASMIIPGAGELTRCGTLQRTDGVPVAQGVGSVIAERLIDLLMLGGLVGLTLLLEFKRVGTYFTGLLSPLRVRLTPTAGSGLFLGTVLVSSLLLAGATYWLWRNKTIQRHPFMIRLLTIGQGVSRGFMGIQQLKQPGLFVGLTLLGYGLVFLSTYVSFFTSSQTITLPPTAALTIMTVSSLGGLAVPTQGGLGTYHFMVSRALVLYGFPLADGVVVATFLHAIGFGINLLLSSVSFLIVPMLITSKQNESTKTIVK